MSERKEERMNRRGRVSAQSDRLFMQGESNVVERWLNRGNSHMDKDYLERHICAVRIKISR